MHEQAYGYTTREERVEVVTLRVVATGTAILAAPPGDWDKGDPDQERSRDMGVGGETVEARVVLPGGAG